MENYDGVAPEANQDEKLIGLFETFQKDPFFWLEKATGLTPQPPKQNKLPILTELLTCSLERFEEIASQLVLDDFEPFVRGKHITWQQTIIFIAYARALNDTLPRRIAVITGKGLGKALAMDEIVWRVKDGETKPVSARDICVGDSILGKQSVTKVVGVFPQEESLLYKVTLDDGSQVVVNGEHLWEVSDAQVKRKLDKRKSHKVEDEWEVITTKEMLERGLRFGNSAPAKRFRLPRQKVMGHLCVPDAYVVGIWYGDGSRSDDSARYTKPDEFIAEKIQSLGVPVGKTDDPHTGQRTLFGYIHRLRELGVPTKTKNNLPPNFLSWDFSSRLELLRGLMDSDGTCHNGKLRNRNHGRKPSRTRHSSFSTSVPSLAKDVALLVRSLGGKTSISVKEKTFYKDKSDERVYCKPSYRVKVTMDINPFSLPRKAELWVKPTQDRYLDRFVDTIEEVHSAESVCFKVDADDELFLVGEGLVVTHNTAAVAWLLCHFLYSFPLAKIMATAPTSDQMFAALWSDIAKFISDMREPFKDTFEWQTAFVRHREAPYTAFARAKTADSLEALRGVHADHMMAVVDEASGVADEIINTGWSTMTNENKIMLLISNFSGNESLIERVHATNDPSYVKLRFSTDQSPIVDQKEVARRKAELIEKGIDPTKDRDYCIDILGIAPPDSSEFAGWYRFFPDELIDKVLRPISPVDHPDYRQRPALGVDPAGEGTDTAPGVLRSFKWAKLIFEQQTSSSDSIAAAIATTLDNVPFLTPSRVFVDAFGVGHDVAQKVLAQSSEEKRRVIRPVLVGESAPESYTGRYINTRAMVYDATRVWFENGGRVETDTPDDWRKELKSIYAKKTAGGKLQIMSKAEMRAKKLRSPNRTDALSLSFVFDAPMVIDGIYRAPREERTDGFGYTPPRKQERFDRHALIPNSF